MELKNMKKLYYDTGSISDEDIEDIGLTVYESEIEYIHYVDDNKLNNLIDGIIEEIEHSEISNKLKQIGIYLDVKYEIDKTVWEDLDNNYIFW